METNKVGIMKKITSKLLTDYCQNVGLDLKIYDITNYSINEPNTGMVAIHYVNKENKENFGFLHVDIVELAAFAYSSHSHSEESKDTFAQVRSFGEYGNDSAEKKDIKTLMSFLLYDDKSNLIEKNEKLMSILDNYISYGRIDMVLEFLRDRFILNLHPSLLNNILMITEKLQNAHPEIFTTRFSVEQKLRKMKKEEFI